MNIVLIHPYIVVRDKDIHMSKPLGLTSLATYLKHVFGKEINVSILDLYALGAENPIPKGDMYVKGLHDEARIHAELSKAKPDLIGVTCCFTGYFAEALEIATMAKRLDSTVPIVMGGTHATLEAKSILRDNKEMDFIVTHEGEITLEQLVRSLRGCLKTKPLILLGMDRIFLRFDSYRQVTADQNDEVKPPVNPGKSCESCPI